MTRRWSYLPPPDPKDMDAEADKIFQRVISKGYEFYDLYGKYYFFWDGKWPKPITPTYRFIPAFSRQVYIPDWSPRYQERICKKVMQQCMAISRPWTPLPKDPRDITEYGDLPTRDDFDAYMVCLFIDGAYKTPDGGVKTQLELINGVYRRVQRFCPGYPIYEPKPKHNKLQTSDNNREDENNNQGDQA